MEAELQRKISQIKEEHKDATGVLLVNSFGQVIEKQGNFESDHSGIISSIMKNAAKLGKILDESESGTSAGAQSADVTAKISFERESLLIRHKQDLTLAIKQRD